MTPLREREMAYFIIMDEADQIKAIKRMAATGVSDYGIAAATRLSVEHIRQILGDRSATIDKKS